MNYISGIQSAIDFIEENLCRNITADDIAASAGYSKYHFHRIFDSVVGCSVKTYLRRRRLTLAAYELHRTEKRVIDIACEYQFESQASFTRSFQQVFGITPGKYRKTKPYLDFTSAQDVTEVFPPDELSTGWQPEIVQRPPMVVVGIERSGLEIGGSKLREDTTLRQIPSVWNEFLMRMSEVADVVDERVTYGIGRPTGGGMQFSYTACVEVRGLEGRTPDGMVRTVAPGGTYAVFRKKSRTSRMDKLSEYIYGIWLPQSGYKLNFGAEIEVYDTRSALPDDDRFDLALWVPIQV